MLIADLQLERKRDNPPPFSELLLQLRIEEHKKTAKENRMKKHLDASKHKVSAYFLAASSLENDPSVENDITELKKQIAQLRSQFTQQKTRKAESNASSPDDDVAELKKQEPKEPFGKRWTDRCQHAFESIIDKLTTAPVLGFANPKLPYILHADASTNGLGSALYQEQEGAMRVIAYVSRGLSKSESCYPTHKLEFQALKWAVTEKFADYLYGVNFTVVTDSNPLTYLLTTAKLDATSYRWLFALSTFSFQLQY